jgi:hypothetical protein
VRASALLATAEADGLVLRMRNHFRHKVPVEDRGTVTGFRIPAGEFELEPGDGSLAIRARAADDAGLARVQEVVSSHLARFARSSDVNLRWLRAADALEERALAWIARYRNAEHLVRTREWACELRPEAGQALRLAALLHDADRFAGARPVGRQVGEWEDEDAVREHAERSAALVAAWLRDQRAPVALANAVGELVRWHETGGTPEADVLQAADSLSFLETNPTARWIAEGLSGKEDARRKLVAMHERIRLATARDRGAVLLARALAEVEEAAA